MKRFLILFLSVLSLQIHAQTANDLYDAGMKFMDMTNYKQAILHFTQCVEKSPYYYDAYLYRGICELKEGNEEKAMLDYNMAIEKKPDYYQAFYQRGLLHEQQGNTALAISDFSSAIKIFPKYIAAYRQRAYAYVKTKEYDLALENQHVLRGGSFHSFANYCKNSFRMLNNHHFVLIGIGFRVARKK